MVIIYLDPPSLTGSCNLPGSVITSGTYCLLGLAPREVYPATSVTRSAVGSYPTISPLPRSDESCQWRYIFCGTFSLSKAKQWTGLPVRKHGAGWCSDFPHPDKSRCDYPSEPVYFFWWKVRINMKRNCISTPILNWKYKLIGISTFALRNLHKMREDNKTEMDSKVICIYPGWIVLFYHSFS